MPGKPSRICFIFILLTGISLFNCATAFPQLVFDGHRQPDVGLTDPAGKTWSSFSLAAQQTEALLRRPATTALLNANQFTDASDAFQDMGLDVVLTTSATEYSMTPDEEWEVIGNPVETSVMLYRYLESKNATYEITKKGAIRIISLDEIDDQKHMQTIVYRVNHLAGTLSELDALAYQIRSSLLRDSWEEGGGSATMQPRIQAGNRLLIVSIHYQHHVLLRQLPYELSVATNSAAEVGTRSSLVGGGINRAAASRLVQVPAAPSRRSSNRRPTADMVLGRAMHSGGAMHPGGMF